MLRFVFFILLVWMVSHNVLGAPRLSNPVFQSLSTKNGLPQDVVNDIVIDDHGFISFYIFAELSPEYGDCSLRLSPAFHQSGIAGRHRQGEQRGLAQR